MSWKWKSRGLVVLFVASFPVLAVAAAPDTTTEFVFDLWNSRQFDRQAKAYRDATAHINARLRETADRMEVKERLIVDLINGRLPYAEVVRQFEMLNTGLPANSVHVLLGKDGYTNEEVAAFSVLQYVSQRGDPVGAALPQFAREYEARYGRPYMSAK